MDRIITFAGWQWRAYWRRFARGGKASAGNQGIALIITGLISIKYVQTLRVAAVEISRGRTAVLEALLTAIFVVWLLAFVSREQRGDGWRRALCLPLSLKELFAIRIASLLTPPYPWMVLAGSIALCYPISRAPRPFLGIAAALGFNTVAFLLGVTVSHLLSIPRWRRLLGAVSFILAAAVSVYVLQQPQPTRLLSVSTLPPVNLVARVATTADLSVALVGVAILSALIVFSLIASVFSFRATLQEDSAGATRKLSFGFSFPGRLSGLVAKDLKHFRRLLDVYLGPLAAVAGCLYLVTVEVASLEISIVFLTMIFLPNSPLAFNCFGLDNLSGLYRYRLLPLNGNAIILSKNFAYVGFVSIQVSPVLLLAGWRLGTAAGLIALTAALSLALAYLAWGNWMSVSHPVKMHFYRFSSSSSSIFDAMAGIAFSSSPGIAMIYLLHNSARLAVLVPIAYGIVYAFSLWLAGRRFPRKLDRIERALA
jgi:hypothetical protein